METELPKVKEIWMSIEESDEVPKRRTISNKARPATTSTNKKTIKEITRKVTNVITKKSPSNNFDLTVAQKEIYKPVLTSKQNKVEVKTTSDTSTREAKGYLIHNQIGQGAYAIVKQGINKSTNEKVAIKMYEKYRIADTQRKASVDREISLLKRLNHPNIVKLYETIDMQRQLWLVMELALGRSLHSFIRSKTDRKLSEKDGMRLFRQIVSGIEYCHKLNVTHRDIKMENILIDDELNVKIIDFGFSICSPPTQRLRIFCGTPSYMAPEIVNKEKYMGPPTDIWSLGILLFTILAGYFPFKGVTEKDLFRTISRGTVIYPTTMSEEVKTLIGKMLQVDPSKRITAIEVSHYNN